MRSYPLDEVPPILTPEAEAERQRFERMISRMSGPQRKTATYAYMVRYKCPPSLSRVKAIIREANGGFIRIERHNP